MKRAVFIFLLMSVFLVCGCGRKETPPHVVELCNTILTEANEDEIGITLEKLQRIRPNCEKYMIADQIDAMLAELMAEKNRIPEKLMDLLKKKEFKRFNAVVSNTREYFPEIDLTEVNSEYRLDTVERFLDKKDYALAKFDLHGIDTAKLTEQQKKRYGQMLGKISNDPKLAKPKSLTAHQKAALGKYKESHGENAVDPETSDAYYFK